MNYLDPQLRRIRVTEGDEASLRHAAACAIAKNQSRTASEITALLKPLVALRHQPISTAEKDETIWSRWHFGAQTVLYAVGDGELIGRCELTDTEREQLMLLMRKAASHDENVYVVASKIEKSSSKTLPRQLTCLGLIFYR